jgi:hypothetical protein
MAAEKRKADTLSGLSVPSNEVETASDAKQPKTANGDQAQNNVSASENEVSSYFPFTNVSLIS